MEIWAASQDHAVGITKIWNFYIRESIVTFNSEEKSVSEIEKLIEIKATKKEPIFVAIEGNQVVGFATYGPFRSGIGYARVAEHTIQLSEAAFGKGIGRALMQKLEMYGTNHHIQSFFAGISGENKNAVIFHKALGFKYVTNIPKIGWKFERWHDLILMRKDL